MGCAITHDEVKRLIRIMMGGYPHYKPTNLEDTLKVWETLLQGEDYTEIEAALYAYMRSDTSGFPPTVGQLIGLKSAVKTDDGLTEGEAWAKVRRAIGDGYYHSEERYRELPKTIQRAVGSPQQLKSWATEDSDTVIQSNFLRAYRQVKERMQKETAVAPTLTNLIKGCCDALSIETGD